MASPLLECCASGLRLNSFRRLFRAARVDLGVGIDMSGDHRVDELLAVIENYEAAVRFIPDWSGESFAHAA